MKTLSKCLLLFLAIICSCDDILEEDITNDTVQIIYPVANTSFDGNTVRFSWQSLDGADEYRVQITTIDQLNTIDTLVPSTELKYTLNTGDYQWRVRGENFAYQSAYTFPINFSVKETNDLSGQFVALQSPSENLYTNIPVTIFNWNTINAAESYNFQLIKKTTAGEQTVFQEANIMSNSITIEASVINEDAEYIWKLKAVNTTSESEFSERSLFLDTTAPNQPGLSEPANENTISPSMVTFNWTNGTDTGDLKSEITNTLEIAADSDFNNIVHNANTVNNSLQYEFTTPNTYYWRVIAIDAASNKSDYSIVRSIIVE
ncbi:hypothetical protein [Hyunsoonleella pacifica]|uniref:Fibronectin type-III domain-containing protein n=1 Tax=Hyunsoonleella pacifica TaxID=1080224 RepID=A0A4Q9FM58_9FLAO|nr:hypothetical protein [Hyunsoonleella pacifica]TBN11959.1 hypothetical protein EYD46_17480 [Hyunsoonleella pacifica]GGD07614.1 hypothetical protein GCM10011368_06940 [Hyunsoonleella pacifica]